jgi:hypothetical protein
MEKNNISTYATWIAIGITAILSYFGIEYDYTALIPVIMGIITLCIAIWSSKNPNNIEWLGNAQNTIQTEEPVLNDEYEVNENDC